MQLHLEDDAETISEETNELDFFKQHENIDLHQPETIIPTEEKAFLVPNTVSSNDNTEKDVSEVASNCLGPSVKLSDLTPNAHSERKSTIGRRVVQSKKIGVSSHICSETATLYIAIIVVLYYSLEKRPGV